jgi:hypothetical protein
MRKAIAVAPCAIETASPSKANIPPPTIPPMPIEIAPVSPTVRFLELIVNLYSFSL